MKKFDANNCEYTDYPNIFKKTYWGNFKKSHNMHIEYFDTIIENRNNFIHELQITKHFTPSINITFYFYKVSPRCDHLEWYKDKNNGIVVIFSNYSSTDEVCICEFLVRLGFTKYKPMYCKTAVTYLALFENLNQLKNNIKNVIKEYNEEKAKKTK
jgi:hypothetical protein